MEQRKKQTKLKIEEKKLKCPSIQQQQSILVDDTIAEINSKLLYDKVTLTDIVKAMNMKTLRTAVRWCKRKGLTVIKFGSENYVNLIDFQLQLDKPFIEALMIKYPNNWAELYHSYKTLDWAKIAGQILNPSVKTKFTVQGNAANDFLDKMKLKMKSHG